MTTDRTAIRESYDAVADLAHTAEDGTFAYGLVKLTYIVSDGALRRTAAEPLLHDLRDPELDPRLRPDTDFWARKPATDFIVRGSAFPAGGGAVQQMRVSARVGRYEKRIQVFGDRSVEWTDRGTIRFGDPEPFEEMPLTWENAYGGIDWRVPVENVNEVAVAAELATDHPGMYPRNPFGKGYLVESGEVEDFVLPNQEDPHDLLTPGRLQTGDPRDWWKQPMPWTFDWTHPATFPRYCWLGQEVDAWFPGPQDESMPEVRRNILPAHYRDLLAQRRLSHGPHPWFKQGGSAGFVLQDLVGGEPVTLSRLHPDRPELSFALPAGPPRIYLAIEAEVHEPPARLHHVICRPAEERVDVVYGVSQPVPRVWLPGIHKHIPVALSVDGDDWIEYEAPTPALEALARAREGQTENKEE